MRIRVPSFGQLVAGNEGMQKSTGISVWGLGFQVVVPKKLELLCHQELHRGSYRIHSHMCKGCQRLAVFGVSNKDANIILYIT